MECFKFNKVQRQFLATNERIIVSFTDMEDAGEEVCIPPSNEFERGALAPQVTRIYHEELCFLSSGSWHLVKLALLGGTW